MHTPSNKLTRRGGVYIAVLGTALIVSVMALSAIGLQRVQHRRLSAALDARQAQLNAQAAIELGLLTIQEDDDWRHTYADTSGSWFTRSTGTGTCSLLVTDPVDGDLDDDPDDPFVLTGVGQSGTAEQRVEMYVDPRTQPADALKAAATAGGIISGRSDVDWNAVVDAYQAKGTPIDYNNLPPADLIEFARNPSVNSDLDGWEDQPPGLPDADFTGPTGFGSHTSCLCVDRRDRRAGAGNRLQVGLLKPDTKYSVSIQVHPNLSLPIKLSNWFKLFMITEYANGTYDESPGSLTQLSLLSNNTWTTLTATVTTPPWTEEPANVYIVVNSDTTEGKDYRFYVDNIHVYENNVTGRLLYRQVLGPNVTNPLGIYWINCSGNTIIIERSRILGTLLLLNPGAGSRIANGPVHFAPSKPGFPSLVVQGDFAVRATNRVLSELENGVNYNLDGTNGNYIYPSEIQGLVAVSGNLTFENQPRVRGQVVAGGTITGSPSLQHRLDAVYSPPPGFTGDTAYERRPASIRKVVLP